MKHVLAHLMLATDIGLIALLALSSLFSPPSSAPLTHGSLYAQAGFTLLSMGLIPLAWASMVRPGNVGPVAYYGLGSPLQHSAAGALWAAASLAAIAGLAALLELVGQSSQNPAADQMQAAMTWPLALAVSASAGLAEEIFFRGFLQRHLGILNQAGLFALCHAGYDSVLQLLGTLLLGLLWGVAAKRSLWAAIIAHSSYDLAVLAP